MKIEIYTLLGLVKDGKAPKKIKYNNIGLEYSEENEDYYSYYGRGLFEYKFGNCKNFLNDKIAIIEEPKKIKKIEKPTQHEYLYLTGKELYENDMKVYNKVNELIDEINNLKEK